MIATDNLSVDRSSEILRQYEREGRLRLLEESGDNYDQRAWVTRMARLAATEHDADWVINDDADEFWWPEEGSLKDVLESVPRRRQAVLVERLNFGPPPPSAEPFFRSMTIRDRSSLNAVGERLPGKSAHRARSDIEVGTGSHYISRPRRLRRRRLKALPVPITILHFPFRSRSQFVNKVEKGGAAASRNAHMWSVWPAMRKLYGVYLDGEIDPYYDGLVLDDNAVTEGIAAGTLVRDERLRDRLEELYAEVATR